MNRLLVLALGYVLDQFIGDPQWLPHPVRLIGRLISYLETVLRRVFPKTSRGELLGGGVLAILTSLAAFAVPALLLWGAGLAHPFLALALESWLCFQILAAKSLRVESMKVYRCLQAGDLAGARRAVAMIVGRDTHELDEQGVTKAAVETVAENAGDGVIAPLFFFALGGAPLGLCFKAVSTLDSMVGYRNSRYEYFGRASARLDDLMNFIPARLCGLLMVAAAPLCGLDGKRAWKVFCRDRKKHKSPNSAHPEAACAGALGICLNGDAYYQGVLHHKPVLGDDTRPVQIQDIVLVNRLAAAASLLGLLLALGGGALCGGFLTERGFAGRMLRF